MEDAHQLLSAYEPIDPASIKPMKIYSEKELEAESSGLCETLKDIKEDWNKRLKALLTVQSIVVSEHLRGLNNYAGLMAKLVAPLTLQLTDLRSQITKEASKAISLMAQVLRQDFEPLAPKFISKNSLYKLLNSAKHILAEHSHICIIAILNNVVAPRIKNAEYLYLILSLYPEESLTNYLNQLEELLTTLIQDAKSEARQIARMAFFRYKEIFPDRASNIFQHLDGQNQKAILDEEDSYSGTGMSPLRYTEVPQKSKSPQKTIRNTLASTTNNANENLGGSLPLPGGKEGLKQVRSVSRGRPQTASNQLTQKVSGLKKQMRSPARDEVAKTKKSLFNLEVCQKQEEETEKQQEEVAVVDQFYKTTPNLEVNTQLSPRLDSSKLRLLKSPRTLTTQNSALTVVTKEQENIQEQPVDTLQIKKVTKSDMPMNSPGLPPEKAKQLRSLKEKKQKQESDSQATQYASVPSQHTSSRNNTRQLQVTKTNVSNQQNQNQPLSSTLRNQKQQQAKNTTKTQEEGDKIAKLKRQKSASPGHSPKSSIANRTNRATVKQQEAKVAQSTAGPLVSEEPKSKQVPTSKRNSKLQVSQSIQNLPKSANQAQSFKMKSQDDDHISKFDEPKEYEELDFLDNMESLDQLLVGAQSSKWNERVKSFNSISKCGDQLQDCSDQLIKKLFKVHLDFLNDENLKVVKAVQDSFLVILQHQSNLLDRYLDQMVPILLFNMVSPVEAVSVTSSDLINFICMNSKPSDIVLILMELLKDHKNNFKVVTASLEVLVVLLKDDYEYCNKNANVLETCLKIVELLESYSNNMDIIMPCIAVLLAMRDKNFDGTMKSLVFLKSNQLTLVRKLASQFAADFEEDIINNVINEQKAMSKLSPNVQMKKQMVAMRNQAAMEEQKNPNNISKNSMDMRNLSFRGNRDANTSGHFDQKISFREQISDIDIGEHAGEESADNDQYLLEDDHTPLNRQSITLKTLNSHNEKSTAEIEILQQEINLNQPIQTNEENLTLFTQEAQSIEPQKSLQKRQSSLLLGDVKSASQEDNDCEKSFKELVMQTQQSQNNYINSKSGDTVDDVVDDGVTPTPRGRKLFKEDQNFQSHAKSFEEEAKFDIIVKEVLELKGTNRSEFLKELEKLMTKTEPELWSSNFLQIFDALVECLSDEETSIKDRTLSLMKSGVETQQYAVRQNLPHILDELTHAYASKKLSPKVEEILLVLMSTQNKDSIFKEMDGKLANQEYAYLQQAVKISNFMVKSVTKDQAPRYFEIIFDSFHNLMGHQSANVRKALVFFMVDMNFFMDKEDYDKFFDRFNSNQQKLVSIYIERKSSIAE